MTAETPLWREQDGPQCAEGGRAHVDLQWRGDRIAVGGVRIDKAGECGDLAELIRAREPTPQSNRSDIGTVYAAAQNQDDLVRTARILSWSAGILVLSSSQSGRAICS